MKTKRWAHACFQDTESSTIYVAGGWDDQSGGSKSSSSTEKWTLEENSWKPSANLPEAITWSSAVSSNTDKFIGYMAGGFYRVLVEYGLGYGYQPRRSKNIYGLKRREKTWIKLNKTMKVGREEHALLNVPANQILGC